MRSRLFRRRSAITLRASDTGADPGPVTDSAAEPLPVGWPWAAAVAGLVAAGVGWVLVVGLTALGWLGAPSGAASGTFGEVVLAGTRLWLLTGGVEVGTGGLRIAVIPWGAVGLSAYVLARGLSLAVRRTQAPAGRAGLRWLGPAGIAAAVYLLPLGLSAAAFDAVTVAPRTLGVLLVVLAAAVWGAARGLDHDPLARLPGWARPLPRAVLGTQLALLATGAAVLATGAIVHRDRLSALTAALDAGVAGNLALLGAQLAYLPNAVVWAASYALGAGFGLGPGTVVSPANTELGLLPGVPLLGALPAEGPGGRLSLFWLLGGVLAGAVAAWCVGRARPGARFDQTCLTGGLAGVLGGASFVVLAWASGGDLGDGRLVGLGPRLPELAVMAVSTLGLSGMVAGLCLGLARREPPPGPEDPDREETVMLDPAAEDVTAGSR